MISSSHQSDTMGALTRPKATSSRAKMLHRDSRVEKAPTTAASSVSCQSPQCSAPRPSPAHWRARNRVPESLKMVPGRSVRPSHQGVGKEQPRGEPSLRLPCTRVRPRLAPHWWMTRHLDVFVRASPIENRGNHTRRRLAQLVDIHCGQISEDLLTPGLPAHVHEPSECDKVSLIQEVREIAPQEPENCFDMLCMPSALSSKTLVPPTSCLTNSDRSAISRITVRR